MTPFAGKWWGATMKILITVLLVVAPFSASAVDVYKCKSADGTTIYQNEPCPQGAKEIAKGEYQRQADTTQQHGAPEAEAAQELATPAPASRDVQASRDDSQGYDEQPASYQCEAGGKTWISKTPCPGTVTKTRTVTNDVPFNGVDQYGNVVSGTGTITERVKEDHAVQQQGLSHDELCKRLQDHAATSYDKKAGSGDSVYERNKARQENGC
jgi:hypothetical protein